MSATEHNQVFAQSVTESSDLLILEIPDHRDVQRVVVFLDFANNYTLVKYVQLKKCHLSRLDEAERQRQTVTPLLTLGTHGGRISQQPFGAEHIQEMKIVYIELQPAIMNISHLRQELQMACKDMSIFWVDKMSKKKFDQTIGARMANRSITLLSRSRVNQVNCDIVDPGLPWAHCRSQCLSYVVKPAPGERTCRYENACPYASYVPSSCIRNVESMKEVRYILCCRDGNAPRCPGTFYQHCSCVT
jgi:hypothetical protein